MYVTLVYVHVKPEHVQDFIEASILNCQESRKEPGNIRFDLLQELDNPSKFVFYEAYTTAEESAAHKQTLHYLKWRDTVADWMAEPRRGVSYNGL